MQVLTAPHSPLLFAAHWHRITAMNPESGDQADKRRLNKAGGAPRGNKNAVKHGLYVYKAMLNGKGLDERTSLYKALREKE